MIFLLAEPDPILMLMLTEADVNDLRTGATKFVDQRQLKGRMFREVHLSLLRDKKAILDALTQAGMRVTEDMLVEPEPDRSRHEAKCQGCGGIKHTKELLAGVCIICWREKAEHYKAEYVEAMKRG